MSTRRRTFTVEIDAGYGWSVLALSDSARRRNGLPGNCVVTETTPFDPQPGDKVHLSGRDPNITITVLHRDGDMLWVKEDRPVRPYNTLCGVGDLRPVR